MRLRFIAALAAASFTFAAIVVACSDETVTSTPSTTEDGGRRDTGRDDEDGGGGTDEDANVPTDGGAKLDAQADAKAARDANGPGEAGADCVFNHDCQLALRCECEGFACTCKPGARGTGKNGIDTCDAGEDCTSSLCVEGPGDSGVSYCSDECETNVDCTGMLPKCTAIASLGKICVRNAN
jgi:hypothetical protein